ncbi:MAG: ATP-dependent DNA helicase II subunit 1 [Claussenomyces sp. TS43310]|nr:MAG: ATP-dependent DNA helicase II subunit 1 [Claussenomyces sp. TS43310]
MSEDWKQKQEEEEQEEEEADDNHYKTQKDAVLFAVDVSKTMLARPPPAQSKKADNDSATYAALKCAYQVMQQRIISNPKDMMGVLLFGTEQSKFQDEDPNSRGGLAYPHCYLLTDLDVPAATDVKSLKDIVEDEERTGGLLVPTAEPVSMSNLLFCANQIFTTRAPNFGSRRLFIITDRDDPHNDDKAMKSAAAVRAKDLYDLGVIIELFPISRPGHEFDRTKFYDDIIYRDPTDPDAPVLSSASIIASSGNDGISLLHSLISNVNSKQVAKRALFSNLPFEIAPGFKISVKGYNILQPEKPARSSYIWLQGEKAQIAVGETMQMAEDTARTVQKTELKKAYKFGGEQVLFTKEEQKQLKNFGPPILRIIGFKPQSMLPIWASISKSTFIYPSEEDYVGSTRVFAALWQKLLKDGKMAFAWYIARLNATPALVALLPSAERLDETSNQQVVPAGIWIYPLPYADDIRSPPETPSPLVSPDMLVDDMRKIIQQLQLPGARYEPSRYPNPSLQWHYRILQAMALDEEIPEFKDADDKSIPKHRQIDKRAGSYVVDWGVALEEQYQMWTKETGGKHGGAGVKREAGEEIGAPPKKIRAGMAKGHSGTLNSMSVVDLNKYVKAGRAATATVAELRDWLGTKGLSTSGKKADLVARLEEAVERM